MLCLVFWIFRSYYMSLIMNLSSDTVVSPFLAVKAFLPVEQRKVSLVSLTFDIQRGHVPRGRELNSASEGP